MLLNSLKFAAAVVLIASPVAAQRVKGARDTALPKQINQLIACRAVADPTQRLACFDREATSVEQAIARKDLVLIDREKARAAKRSLFGFSVPDFGGLFGGDEDQVKQIEGTIVSADYRRNLGWTIKLSDGSVWMQTDDTALVMDPRRGDKVVVRRATLGAFMVSVAKQRGFRAKRIG